jgi:NTP pyrophosphatase (non-canonical NTP hydrolase)
MTAKEKRYIEAVNKAMHDKAFFLWCLKGSHKQKILPPEKLIEIADYMGEVKGLTGKKVKVYSLGINIFTGDYPFHPPEKIKELRDKKAFKLRMQRQFKTVKTNACKGITEKLIETVHANAVAKGFWSDKGSAEKKDTTLLLIISEIGEAVECLRTEKRANMEGYYSAIPTMPFKDAFKQKIKDTLEDELADIYIRLVDYCGAFQVKYSSLCREMEKEKKAWEGIEIKPLGMLFTLCRTVTDIKYSPFHAAPVGEALAKVEVICEGMGINLHKHVEMKMKYNEQREVLHGKKF